MTKFKITELVERVVRIAQFEVFLKTLREHYDYDYYTISKNIHLSNDQYLEARLKQDEIVVNHINYFLSQNNLTEWFATHGQSIRHIVSNIFNEGMTADSLEDIYIPAVYNSIKEFLDENCIDKEEFMEFDSEEQETFDYEFYCQLQTYYSHINESSVVGDATLALLNNNKTIVQNILAMITNKELRHDGIKHLIDILKEELIEIERCFAAMEGIRNYGKVDPDNVKHIATSSVFHVQRYESFQEKLIKLPREFYEIAGTIDEAIEEINRLKIKVNDPNSMVSTTEWESIIKMGRDLNKVLAAIPDQELEDDFYQYLNLRKDDFFEKIRYTANERADLIKKKQKKTMEILANFSECWEFYLLIEAITNNPKEYLDRLDDSGKIVENCKTIVSDSTISQVVQIDQIKDLILSHSNDAQQALLKLSPSLSATAISMIGVAGMAGFVVPAAMLALQSLSLFKTFKNKNIKEEILSQLKQKHAEIKTKIIQELTSDQDRIV